MSGVESDDFSAGFQASEPSAIHVGTGRMIIHPKRGNLDCFLQRHSGTSTPEIIKLAKTSGIVLGFPLHGKALWRSSYDNSLDYFIAGRGMDGRAEAFKLLLP